MIIPNFTKNIKKIKKLSCINLDSKYFKKRIRIYNI